MLYSSSTRKRAEACMISLGVHIFMKGFIQNILVRGRGEVCMYMQKPHLLLIKQNYLRIRSWEMPSAKI